MATPSSSSLSSHISITTTLSRPQYRTLNDAYVNTRHIPRFGSSTTKQRSIYVLGSGIEFLKKHAGVMEDEADNQLPSGFEIVFPAMLNEAKQLCLDLPYELPFIKQMIEKREATLKRISSYVLCTAPTIFLYQLEGLQEIVEWHKIINLQSKDGSFLGSPASTAAVFMRTGNTKCLEFLNFVLMKFGNHVPCHYPLDLMERLWAVDTVERLGIDRHFKKEIKDALAYVYSHWDERGIGCGRENPVTHIDVTAMGLRILRLHGYNVSSGTKRKC